MNWGALASLKDGMSKVGGKIGSFTANVFWFYSFLIKKILKDDDDIEPEKEREEKSTKKNNESNDRKKKGREQNQEGFITLFF
jgi:hypothetical protein